jgi:predicted lipoprotein
MDAGRPGHLLTAVLLASAVGCRVATVRPIDAKASVAGPASGGPFDAAAFVESIWASEVLKAVDSGRDVAGVVAIPRAPGAAPLAVRGRGRVVAVDTRSRRGTATVELDGGRAQVLVQVGPVLAGTAIRDALPALGFDRFVNQIQHADVGNELNARVERDLLAGLDLPRLRGRHVSFAGMASFPEGAPVTVTPVRLKVEP